MRLAGLEPVPEFFVLAEKFVAGMLSVEAFAQTLLARGAPSAVCVETHAPNNRPQKASNPTG